MKNNFIHRKYLQSKVELWHNNIKYDKIKKKSNSRSVTTADVKKSNCLHTKLEQDTLRE